MDTIVSGVLRVRAVSLLHCSMYLLLFANCFQWLVRSLSPTHCRRKPDTTYNLDLTVPDHRRIAWFLVNLAVVEPGENWQDELYQPRLNEDPIPGWELPMSWEEKGPQDVGRLRLTYYSGADEGCFPVWESRLELQEHVLMGTDGVRLMQKYDIHNTARSQESTHGRGDENKWNLTAELRNADMTVPVGPIHDDNKANVYGHRS